VSAWAGADKRRPHRSYYNWSLREPLARWLEDEGRRAGAVRVLDVGCGDKPYQPYFSAASEFVGVDIGENPHADVTGRVEALPLEDAGFDVVLCIQVLEHVDDPAQAVRELHRVVKPGGRVLAATHGTYVYHPGPVDHWRWTHTGLLRLFETNADWRSVSVVAGAGTSAAVALLLGLYVDQVAQRLHAVWAGRLVNYALNSAAAALDRRTAALREPIPGSLTTNFHIVAER
jgi:SAM-dependent methyltransferase